MAIETAGGVYTSIYCHRQSPTCCESIRGEPTQADDRDVLEHHGAAKDPLAHRIRGMHQGDLERGMLNLRPTLDTTHSNRFQVRIQVDKVTSHCIESARDKIPELYDHHRFESTAEHLEFIDSHQGDNKYLFPIAAHVEGGACGPNQTHRESKAANEWLASTLLPSGSNPKVYVH